MWVRHTERNVGPPHLRFLFAVGPPPSSLCNVAFRETRIPSVVGVDISVDRSFQSYQNPDNFKSWRACSFQSYQKSGRHYTFRQLSELKM